MMWTVVYIAPSRVAALEIKDSLGRDGILATVRPVNLQVPGDEGSYEVLVSEAEAEEAHELVNVALQKSPG